MKYKYILIALVLASCAVTKPRPAQPIRLTVTYVHREDGSAEVWAKRGYMLYMAHCKNLSDTVKIGTVITAQSTKDSCDCLFKRVK